MDHVLIATLKSRIERCRRLAEGIGDHAAATALRDIAEEEQAQLDRLLAAGN